MCRYVHFTFSYVFRLAGWRDGWWTDDGVALDDNVEDDYSGVRAAAEEKEKEEDTLSGERDRKCEEVEELLFFSGTTTQDSPGRETQREGEPRRDKSGWMI